MSTSSDNRLAGVRAKIGRARQHIRDLDARIAEFRKSRPFVKLSDQKTGDAEAACHVRIQPFLPVEFALVAGDAVHNLRSSLDHLACQLAAANGQPIAKQSFPIFKTAAEYDPRPAHIKGISMEAKERFKTVQPFQTGYDALWGLHELDIIDKHKLLLVAAFTLGSFGISYRNPAIDPAQIEAMDRQVFAESSRPAGTPGAASIMLEDGAAIEVAMPGMSQKMNMNIECSFDITFSEPTVVQGKPIVQLLDQFAKLVEDVVNRFVPLL